MSSSVNRRDFLKSSLLVSGASLLSREEQTLWAGEGRPPGPSRPQPQLPTGRIGNLEVTRLICGGNLIAGFAHARDLIYVSDFLRHYFTDEKVWETLARCEEQGINTAILRLDENTLRILDGYRNRLGGKMQWIAQCKIAPLDIASGLQPAIDHGADALFIHGGVADELVAGGKLDVLAKAIEFVQAQGLPAGCAGHMVEVPMALEEAGIEVDFYMKTLNAKNYWSAGPMPRNDSVWEETPEQTISFMRDVKKPWIAYKVLGAGAIEPREGFEYAFRHGADFICVGMFDWQVADDAAIARKLVEGDLARERPWCA